MQIAHKIELNATNKQKTYFAKACGVSRFTWNWALTEWNKRYEENKKILEVNPEVKKELCQKISGMSLKKDFNSIKKKDFPWMYGVTKYASQQPFLDLQDAWGRFFKKTSKGRPKLKKKGKCRDSFYVGGDQIKIRGKKIHVPNLGLVRLKESPRFTGKINSATFSRIADKWFVSLQFELDDRNEFCPNVKTPIAKRHVGVDLGITFMAVTSDGHAVISPMPLKKSLRRLKRQQRKLSKKIRAAKRDQRPLRESKNFQKQKLKVAKIHYRITNLRKDISHKLTTFLTNNYSSIAIEDLNVKGMSKNHRLARSILDVGFGEIRRQIEYKSKWRGESSSVTHVDRFFPSSKTCNSCKKINNELTLKDRIFTCQCGNVVNRDYNASLNLRDEMKDRKIGGVPAEFRPVEMAAMQRAVHPLVVTSIVEAGRKH